jgi:hypothetical protein
MYVVVDIARKIRDLYFEPETGSRYWFNNLNLATTAYLDMLSLPLLIDAPQFHVV